MTLSRRRAVSSLGALAAAAAVPQVLAQSAYPSRPIRIILPYTGGGSADALARAIGEHLRTLGQPVIVESHPGANSMLGADLAAKAPKDGYTLLYLGWPTISTNLVSFKDVRYKLEDFQPITTLYRSPVSLTVRKDFPANNLKELIEYARKNGRRMSYGTSGTGSSPHLLLEKMSATSGITFEHVPYKGEGPAVLDVLGGHLPLFAGSIATPLQHLRSGALKVIATSSSERLPAFPDVMTFKESGFPEHVFTYWHGFAAPAGTPRPIIDKLHATIVAAMSTQAVRNVLSPDQIPYTLSPEQFTALIRQDIDDWGPVIRAAKLVQ